jgi:serine acetyltransferase
MVETFSMDDSLKAYFHAEINGLDKPFSWIRVLRKAWKGKQANYLFWWRIASRLHRSKYRFIKSFGKTINRRITRKHGMEIMMGAQIGPGLDVGHMLGNCITSGLIAGKNLHVKQNTQIGSGFTGECKIVIGDNVVIGTNTCILGSDIRIGNNVQIGAMSYVNKDIPDDATFITVKESRITIRKDDS